MRRVALHKNNSVGIASDALKLRPQQLGRELVNAAKAGIPTARQFVDELIAGAPESFLAHIGDLLKSFSIVTQPAYPKGARRRFTWYESMQLPPLPLNPTTVETRDLYGKPDRMVQEPWAWGLVVVSVVDAGLIDWFHRCHADDCSNVFFGDPRSRWCSKTCGSRQRVRETRVRRRRK